MDAISSYMQSTHLALQQTVAYAVADMAMNGSAAQMADLVSQMTEAAPAQHAPVAVDGLGANLDVRA